ncbi:MAG: hydrogenase maturation nickel metallochaperone HypA [Lachnospiraceae bacterium]
MHELSITKSLVKTVLTRFDENTMKCIRAVNLVMGGMNDYEEAWLQKYMDELAKGTPLEGAKLNITKLPISFRCRKCGEIFPMDLSGSDVACPGCGSLEYDMHTGREFYVENMEIEEK